MKCPNCHAKTRIKHTRHSKSELYKNAIPFLVRRRHFCEACDFRITTYEVDEKHLSALVSTRASIAKNIVVPLLEAVIANQEPPNNKIVAELLPEKGVK